MADELTLNISAHYVKSAVDVQRAINALVAVSGNHYTYDILLVDHTTPTVLNAGSVTTLGYLLLFNKDATNYVTIGREDGGTYRPFCRLKALEMALLRLEPGITVKLKANTADCDVEQWLIED